MATTINKRSRLSALEQGPGRLSVDRSGSGAIRGLSVITTGEALGHGFEIDGTTVEQVAAALDGIAGRWTHGSLSEDGLAKHLGAWRGGKAESLKYCPDCRKEADDEETCPECGGEMMAAERAVGDFEFSASAHKLKPDGLDVPAPVYLMDRAEEDPSSLGISIVALFDLESVDVLDADGKKVGTKSLARLSKTAKRPLQRGDFVADPAANPVGLSALHAGTGSDSEAIEVATTFLDSLTKTHGEEGARCRALAFLDRHFGRTTMPTPDKPAETPTVTGSASSVDPQKLEAALATANAKNEALAARLAKLEADEADRKKQATAAYLSAITTESAKCGAPIPGPDIEKVTALFARGEDSLARELGDAYLSRSKALGTPFSNGTHGQSVALGESTKADEAEIKNHVAATLAAVGFTKKGA